MDKIQNPDKEYYILETIKTGASYVAMVAAFPGIPMLYLNAGAEKLGYGKVYSNEEIFN